MSNTTEVTDITQRIVEAMARSDSEIYDSIGEEGRFNPKTQTIVGEVPIHLRKLHNLLSEVSNQSRQALTRAKESEETVQEKIAEIIKNAGGVNNLPKEEPAELKQLKLETEKFRDSFKALQKQHEIVHSLFFNSLYEHFPILTATESDFTGSSIVTDWQITGDRTEENSESTTEILGILIGVGRVEIV